MAVELAMAWLVWNREQAHQRVGFHGVGIVTTLDEVTDVRGELADQLRSSGRDGGFVPRHLPSCLLGPHRGKG
jgi:hypothetical protein